MYDFVTHARSADTVRVPPARRRRDRRHPAVQRRAGSRSLRRESLRRRRRRHPPHPPDPPRHGQARAPARRDPRAVPDHRSTDAPAVRRAEQALRRRDRAARRTQRGRHRDDRRQDPAPPRARRGRDRDRRRSPATGERVLVVDDEAGHRRARRVSSRQEPATASPPPRSGTDALDAARQERPALVVLDLMLPGLSGYDVLEQLRAQPATRDIAVLMLTARREEPDRIRGLSLGADDYLTKPFSPQELVLRVGAILRRVGAGGAAPPTCSPSARSTIDRARASRARSTASRSSSRRPSTSCCSRSPSGAGACRVARTCSRRCGKPRRTSRRAPWTCTFSGCARSSASAGDLIETVRGFGYRLQGGTVAQRVTLAKRLLARLAGRSSSSLVAAIVAHRGQPAARPARARRTTDELEREARLVAPQWQPRVDADSLADAAGARARASRHADRHAGVVVGDSEFDARARCASSRITPLGRRSSRRAQRASAARARPQRIGGRRRDLRRGAAPARLRARVGRHGAVSTRS